MATRRKRLVIVFLFFFSFIFISERLCANISIEVLVEPEVPRMYEDFQILVRVHEGGSFKNRIYFNKDSFSNSLIFLGGPYVKSVQEDVTDYIYTVRATEIGKIFLPDFFYDNGKSVISFNSISIEIFPQNFYLDNYKITGSYRNPPLSVYQGQAFDVILEAQNLSKLMPVSVQNIPLVSNAIIENAPGLGNIFQRKVQDVILYNVPVMAWIFASNHVGTITLPPISMRAGGHIMMSQPVTIQVLPLPMESRKSGAVGNFSLSSEISEYEIEEDSSILMKLRLDGEGNFHILRFPEIIVDDLYVSIHDEDEVRMLVPSKRGYSGYVERTYRIRPKQAVQTSSIVISEFGFWDPKLLLIQQSSPRVYNISIRGSNDHSDIFTFFPTETILLKKDLSVMRIVSFWFLLIPLLFVMVWKKKKEKFSISFFTIFVFPFSSLLFPTEIPSILRVAEHYIDVQDWQAVQQAFADAVKVLPGHKAVLTYNQAVAMQKMNKVGCTGYYLMRSIQYNPFDPVYRKAWNIYQNRLKLSSSVVQYGFIYPVYIYNLLCLFAFIILLIGVLTNKKHWCKKWICLSLVALLTMTFIVMIAYQSYGKKSWAIALEDLNLRQIPETDSSTLYMVKQGTLLEVVANFDNFYLLRNHSEKIEGWTTVDGFVLNLER